MFPATLPFLWPYLSRQSCRISLGKAVGFVPPFHVSREDLAVLKQLVVSIGRFKIAPYNKRPTSPARQYMFGIYVINNCTANKGEIFSPIIIYPAYSFYRRMLSLIFGEKRILPDVWAKPGRSIVECHRDGCHHLLQQWKETVGLVAVPSDTMRGV